VTIPYGADYDDDGNFIETAIEAYDRVHGDPEVPWPGRRSGDSRGQGPPGAVPARQRL